MGAHSFEDYGRGKTAEEAFQRACADATYENGHNAYNGTISTNENFIIVPLKDGETIEQWIERQWDNPDVQKWGPCACVQDPEDPERWIFAGWASC